MNGLNEIKKETRYIVKYFYIGSKKYHGSQRQADFPTIESTIISALKEKGYIKSPRESRVDFASRTDKLVSARGSTFSFSTKKKLYLMELNTALPKNIGVWSQAEVPLDFSSRRHAILRHYRYLLPYTQDTSKHLDISVLKKACEELEGTHDFKNFCKIDKDQANTIRTIELASVKMEDRYVTFDFKSKSFLRQQIRRMVRKIIDTGEKTITFQEFLELFDISRSFSYQPADPTNLVLWDISYEDNVKFKIDPKSIDQMRNYFKTKQKSHELKSKLFSVLQQDNAG